MGERPCNLLKSEKKKIEKSLSFKKLFYIRIQRIKAAAEGKWGGSKLFLSWNATSYLYVNGNNLVRTENK